MSSLENSLTKCTGRKLTPLFILLRNQRSQDVDNSSIVLDSVGIEYDHSEDLNIYDHRIETCESVVLEFRDHVRTEKYDARKAGNDVLTRTSRSIHERVLRDYVSALQQKGRPTEKAVRSLFFLLRLLLEQALRYHWK